MKTTKLDLDIQKFIQTLKAEPLANERVKICSNAKKELLKSHLPNTAKTYLTKYRKALINEIGENKHLLSFLRLPKAADLKIKKEYNCRVEKLVEQLSNQGTENKRHVIPNPTQLIEFAKELIKEESYLKVALGLMLLTGRRSAEILKTAIFHKIGNKVFEVVFEGQTKKGDSKNLPYRIPILAPANDIIKALKYIRDKKDFIQLTNSQVNTKSANSLNEYTKQLFKVWLGDGCTPHDLRKAWIILAYFQSGGDESFIGFAEKYLGHVPTSELTTYTYLKYTI